MAGGWLCKKGWWLGLILACGGRTLDDGAYDAPGRGSGDASGACRYKGITVENGTLVADPCVCFCDNRQFQCQTGCEGPGSSIGAGASSVGGGSPMAAGAPSVAGAPSAGAPAGGAASAGATGIAGGSAIACGPVLRADGQLPSIDDMEDERPHRDARRSLGRVVHLQ